MKIPEWRLWRRRRSGNFENILNFFVSVDFEQVNVSWEIFLWTNTFSVSTLMALEKYPWNNVTVSLRKVFPEN